MQMAKKQINTSAEMTKQTWIIVITSILLVLGLLILKKKLASHEITSQPEQQTEITQTPEYPVDTENDGVYTNSQFGFKFQYPDETFVYQTPPSKSFNSYGWLKQEWFPDKHLGDYFLYLEIGKSYDNMYTNEEAKKLSIDQSIGDRNVDYIHRLKPINNTIPNGIFYYWELDRSTELKRIVYTYSVSWEKDGTAITISLGSPNKKILESKYSIFKDIVNSIELF
jgi:hypothetical protein